MTTILKWWASMKQVALWQTKSLRIILRPTIHTNGLTYPSISSYGIQQINPFTGALKLLEVSNYRTCRNHRPPSNRPLWCLRTKSWSLLIGREDVTRRPPLHRVTWDALGMLLRCRRRWVNVCHVDRAHANTWRFHEASWGFLNEGNPTLSEITAFWYILVKISELEHMILGIPYF